MPPKKGTPEHDKWRANLSKAKTGKPLTQAQIAANERQRTNPRSEKNKAADQARREARLGKPGHPNSVSTRELIRIARTGTTRTKPYPEEARQILRIKKLARKDPPNLGELVSKGKLAKNGGRYSDPGQSKEYENWREAVLARDNFTCQRCGITQAELQKTARKTNTTTTLHAHHIRDWDDFPEFRFDVANGKTLCFKCHRTVHKLLKVK